MSARVPPGIPTGGQFATQAHAPVDMGLLDMESNPTVTSVDLTDSSPAAGMPGSWAYDPEFAGPQRYVSIDDDEGNLHACCMKSADHMVSMPAGSRYVIDVGRDTMVITYHEQPAKDRHNQPIPGVRTGHYEIRNQDNGSEYQTPVEPHAEVLPYISPERFYGAERAAECIYRSQRTVREVTAETAGQGPENEAKLAREAAEQERDDY